MKKPIELLTDDELFQFPMKNIAEGWFFRIDEIALGYYRIQGVDRWRHTVSRDGINPDELIEKCKEDISEMFPDG